MGIFRNAHGSSRSATKLSVCVPRRCYRGGDTGTELGEVQAAAAGVQMAQPLLWAGAAHAPLLAAPRLSPSLQP